MNVKVINIREKSVQLYECDAVKGDKEGADTIILPLRMIIDKDRGIAEFQVIARIVLPRDGNIAYVENESGGTIDTFRSGEDLPMGRPVEIRETDSQIGPESDRERVFRGLPRGTGPGEDLDVVGTEGGKASLPVQRPLARG